MNVPGIIVWKSYTSSMDASAGPPYAQANRSGAPAGAYSGTGGSAPAGAYRRGTTYEHASNTWSRCRCDSTIASTEYSPAKRCSVDREPVPKSTSRWKPSASTRYDEQGESGPGKLPAQPRTVNLIRPLRSAAAPPR